MDVETRISLALTVALLALSAMAATAQAAVPLSAHGSAEQVYATGLQVGKSVSLLNRTATWSRR